MLYTPADAVPLIKGTPGLQLQGHPSGAAHLGAC